MCILLPAFEMQATRSLYHLSIWSALIPTHLQKATFTSCFLTWTSSGLIIYSLLMRA